MLNRATRAAGMHFSENHCQWDGIAKIKLGGLFDTLVSGLNCLFVSICLIVGSVGSL